MGPERNRLLCIAHRGLGGKHFVNTVDGYRCARHEDEGHADHQKRHDNLHRILHEGHHIAHLHGGLLNLMPADPHDHETHHIHQKHHCGHHKGGNTVDEAVVAGQVAVGDLKPILLISLRAEGADDHHAA